MWDILFYILFDSTIEGSVNTRLPKGLRYTLLAIVAVVFFAGITGLIWTGAEKLKTSTGAGVAMILAGVAAFFLGIFWYFHTMKKMKEQQKKNAEHPEAEEE